MCLGPLISIHLRESLSHREEMGLSGEFLVHPVGSNPHTSILGSLVRLTMSHLHWP